MTEDGASAGRIRLAQAVENSCGWDMVFRGLAYLILINRLLSARRYLPLAPISLIFLLAFPSEHPQLHWQSMGPGGGGALFEPTVSPHDSNRILVACDMTGAYLSNDAGESWHMFNLRGSVRFFVFDQLDSNVIYAKSIGLWRSTDAGRTWRLIYPDPAKVTAIQMSNDHANEILLTSGASESVVALAIDPADSKTLYAAVQRGNSEALFLSTDWGKHWTAVSEIAGGTRRIYIDPRSPGQDRTLYVVGKNAISVREHGIFRQGPAPPGGDTFSDVSLGFPRQPGAPVIYVASHSGIFVSEDGGTSWRQSELPGYGSRVRAIATSLTHPDFAFVSYSNLKQGIASKAYLGVARTADRGRNWELVWAEANDSAANLHDAWVSQFFGPQYPENPLGLFVAESDPNIVYSTDKGRVLRTTDGGKNWQAVYSSRQADSTYTGRGLEATTSYGVHFDPFDPKRIFISYTDIGLFRSENGGHSWTASTAGVPHEWLNTTYWMVFDPQVRQRAWAVMSDVHDLPRSKMWHRRFLSSYQGGVTISDDGGKTWRKSSDGMAPTAPTHILLDPNSRPDARVLYVAAFGRGVYKSTNGGQSWRLKNNGIAGTEPFAWRLARDSLGALYLIVVRRSDDGSIANKDDGALYRSTDGAEHWMKIALPEGVNGPNGLAVDPQDPTRLYLAAWGRNTPPQAQGGGIFLSKDSGKTWRNVLSRDQHIYDVTIDPRDGRILYAAGFESCAWRSSDRGLTWNQIRGLNFKWGHRVIPDPLDARQIYVTTFGGGVWHGPAQGDSGAVDEIATPALAHGK